MKKTTTVIYEAFDGTVFKDEESCKKYEQENAYIAYEDAVEFMKADGAVCPCLNMQVIVQFAISSMPKRHLNYSILVYLMI